MAVREGKQLPEGLADPPDEIAYRRLAVARAEQPVAGPGQRLHGLGANLGRARSEPPVHGQEMGRDPDIARGGA